MAETFLKLIGGNDVIHSAGGGRRRRWRKRRGTT